MKRRAASSEVGRQTKRTLYIVAGLYVVVGFVIATASAVGGDRLGTFLGFLIISGAIGAAVLLRAVLHIEVCMSAVGAAIEDLRGRIEYVDRSVARVAELVTPTASSSNGSGVRILDLAAMGKGDPSMLTAATLDQHGYPRLVTAEDEAASLEADENADSSAWSVETPQPGAEAKTNALIGQWERALANNDLGGCRAAYAAIIDAAGEATAAPLLLKMRSLADGVERSLRDSFTQHLSRADYAAAIAIGERMCHLLPERRVAQDFLRVRPYLERRAQIGAREITAAAQK